MVNDTFQLLQMTCQYKYGGKGKYNIEYYDRTFYESPKGLIYELDTLFQRELIINFIDTQKRIVSGEFNLRGISKSFKDTITITKGRFDLNFTFN